MKRTTIRLFGIASWLGLMLFLEGCAGLFGGRQRSTNADLTLISFGSLEGEIAPCG
jgi:hypothetical protein